MSWYLDLCHDSSLKSYVLERRSIADMADGPMEDVEASIPTESMFDHHTLTLTPIALLNHHQLPLYPPGPQSSSTIDTMPFPLTAIPDTDLENQPSSTSFPSPPATVLTQEEPLPIPPAVLSQVVEASLPSPPSTLLDPQEPVTVPPLELFNPIYTSPAFRMTSSNGSFSESVSFAGQVEVHRDKRPSRILDEQEVPTRYQPNDYVTQWLESIDDM